MKYCTKCGAQLLEGKHFCIKCGAKIEEQQIVNSLVKEEEVAIEEIIVNKENEISLNESNDNNESKIKKTSKLIFIPLTISLVVLMALVGLCLDKPSIQLKGFQPSYGYNYRRLFLNTYELLWVYIGISIILIIIAMIFNKKKILLLMTSIGLLLSEIVCLVYLRCEYINSYKAFAQYHKDIVIKLDSEMYIIYGLFILLFICIVFMIIYSLLKKNNKIKE